MKLITTYYQSEQSKAMASAGTKLLRAKKFGEIPGPPRIPLWGTLYLFKLGTYKTEEYHNALLDMYERYGPLVREDIGLKKIIHAFDPGDAKVVFDNEGHVPWIEPLQDTTQLYRKRKNTSPGLGNTNGEEWYRLRSAVRKLILRPKEVQRYLPKINEISDEFVKRLAGSRNAGTNEITDLRLETGKWSREVSGWICFGRRLGSFDRGKGESEATKTIGLNKKGFKLSSELKFSLPLYRYIPIPKWNELVKAEDSIHNYVMDLINESINNRGIGFDESVLSHLISRKELSKEDVKILILSIFGDGLSTTVPTLLYNMYCLSINPEMQERLRKEVQEATQGGTYISQEIINNNLQYLKAFVKETFRMYPIGTEISRVIQNDLVLSNYLVPKGTHVHLNQFVQFKSGKYFKNPEEFKPERWLRDGSEEIDPIVLVPFGHGTRTCAGRRFAEQDLYVLLSKILLNFELGYRKEDPPLKQVYQILLFPKEPLRIQFRDLTDSKCG